MVSAAHVDSMSGGEIAVVGMAGRFPGAGNVAAFWENIRRGVESVTSFTDEALRAKGVSPASLDDPSYVKSGVLLDGVDRFDAGFFGYAPREAEQLDPQQRLFLECAWHAMEDAGYDPARVRGAVGVYAGTGANLYLMKHLLAGRELGADGGIADLIGVMNGNAPDALCSRVAYKLDLRGPAVSIQTACSTSLVAVHTACQALLGLDCDMALAGGVWLNLLQEGGYRHQPGAILSSDGHCRAFDADADGTVLGSGAGIVVLKRLEDALQDGDTVHAVIKGSAINNDGADKVGYTAPSVDGQADVIRAAQTVAGVDADSIALVEAHGTGTSLGDPIEVAALTQAFRASTSRHGFCALGSVKTNVGHLDAAAGVTGLIKAVMALKHRVLPASLNFQRPNPRIDFTNSPFYVNTTARPWPGGPAPRRAGVSSFGMGGTNAHVVLEEAPTVATAVHRQGTSQTLCLSARSVGALKTARRQLAAHLAEHPDLSLADVAHTLRVGRRCFDHRATVIAASVGGAVELLDAPPQGNHIEGAVLSGQPTVAFVFPGQGAQHVGMARELYSREPVFRGTLDRCCDFLAPYLGTDLRTWIHPAPGDEAAAAVRLARTELTQPALFAVEYAMARLWMSRGVQPDAMLGHSLGEYVAACLAGVFSLEDALLLVAERGRLMQSTRAGAMLAVVCSEAALRAGLADGCDLAAVNADTSCVLSGTLEGIELAERRLGAQGVASRRLEVSHAFHSSLLDPVVGAFEALVARVTLHEPSIPFVSNVTGDWITAAQARSPGYWAEHLRATVRFGAGLDTLLAKVDRIVLEVGPGNILSGLVKRHPMVGPQRPVLVSQAPASRPDLQADQPARCLAALWIAGVDVDVAGNDPRGARRVSLPGYPFERESFWVRPAAQVTPASVSLPAGLAPEDWFHVPVWNRTQPLASPDDRAVEGVTLLLGRPGGFADALQGAFARRGHATLLVTPGAARRQVGEWHHEVRPDHHDDLRQLIDDVAAGASMVRICHLWTLGITDADELQTSGFFSLRALGHALNALQGVRPVSITVLTDGLEDVTGGEPLCAAKATLHGPCQTLPQELPQVTCRLVDLALPVPRGHAESALADALVAETMQADAGAVVAYRNRHRWRRGFEPVRREVPVRQRLRRGGVYLITGGLGGIGLTLAAHLARTWQARLVLVGRTPLEERSTWPARIASPSTPPALRQRLQQLRALDEAGGEWLALQADMADRGQVEAMLSEARRRFGRIDGVVHAAGVDSRDAGGPGRDAADAVLRPKMAGTQVLMAALASEPPDFVVLCSSLASVAGGAGKMDYAAANAYLDAVAVAQDREEGPAVFSIDWDGWRDVGMAAEMNLPTGVGITPSEGARAFERIVNGPAAPQTLVCTTDLSIRFGSVDQLVAGLASARPGATTGSRHPRPSHLADRFVPPSGRAETQLADLWSELLGIAPIGAADNLFELGGDSLLAIQLTSRIRASFGVDVPVKALFAQPVLRDMAVALGASAPPGTDAPTAFAVAGHADAERGPLSYAQQRMWYLWKISPAGSAFNIATVLRIGGDFDPAALQSAFQQLVERHDVLRTVFEDDDGKATQVVQPRWAFVAPVLEPGEVDPEAFLKARVGAVSREPFDLERGPLLRVEAVRMAVDLHAVLLVMHHIVTDGWSIALLLREFAQCYDAGRRGTTAQLPGITFQYRDFAVAQRRWLDGGETARQVRYWRERLEGVPALTLPGNRHVPAQRAFPAGLHGFAIDTELGNRLRTVAQRHGATPFMVLLTALSVVFRERSGVDLFHVGTDMANRNRQETEALMGFFVNQVPLRIDCGAAKRASELLAQVQRTVVDAADHQDLPFDRLVEALRTGERGGRAPLFQVKVIYQDDVEAGLALPGLRVSFEPVLPPEAELDLLVSFLASATGFRVEIKFDREVYGDDTIDGLQRELTAVLAAVVEDPATDLDGLRDRLAELRRAEQERLAQAQARQLAQMRSGLAKPRSRSVSTDPSL